ncbi:MAG: hypothetical protein Q8L86_06515 [Vicinamibacterales bacterium]|nr:hypothetical protein [Vicinamibacterales bacterium]
MTRAARASYALVVAGLLCAHLPSAPSPHATSRTAPAADLRFNADLAESPIGILTGDRARESRTFTRTTLDGHLPTQASLPALTRAGHAPRGVDVSPAASATASAAPRGPPASTPLHS